MRDIVGAHGFVNGNGDNDYYDVDSYDHDDGSEVMKTFIGNDNNNNLLSVYCHGR